MCPRFPHPAGRPSPDVVPGERQDRSEHAAQPGGQVRGDEEHRHADPQEASSAEVEIGGDALPRRPHQETSHRDLECQQEEEPDESHRQEFTAPGGMDPRSQEPGDGQDDCERR
jgi:hypothetical protein